MTPTTENSCNRCNSLELKFDLENPCENCRAQSVQCSYDPRSARLASESTIEPDEEGTGLSASRPIESHRTALLPEIAQEDATVEHPNPSSTYPGLEFIENRLTLMPKLYEKGYLALIDQVHEDETDRAHPLITKTSRAKFRRVCVSILASMHGEVLAGLVNGNLGKRWIEGDTNLEKLFGTSTSQHNTAWIKHAEGVSPALYGLSLIGADGSPPNGKHKLEIVHTLRRYISREAEDIDVSMAIDSEPPEHHRGTKSNRDDIAHGKHAYLTEDGQRIDARVVQIESFCNAVEQICNSPLPQRIRNGPWFYIRWSTEPMNRPDDCDDRDTSFLIGLVARIANVLFPRTFHIENFILAYLVTEEEGTYGEILLTAIASAYHGHGTGLCVQPAGLGTQSARMDEWTVKDARQMWNACKTWRDEHTPYNDNMRRLDAFLDERKARIEKLAAEKEKTILELEKQKDAVRPDFESAIKEIEEWYPLQPSTREALGEDLAGIVDNVSKSKLEKIRGLAADWDSGRDFGPPPK
jgi:hypothetical protein